MEEVLWELGALKNPTMISLTATSGDGQTLWVHIPISRKLLNGDSEIGESLADNAARAVKEAIYEHGKITHCSDQTAEHKIAEVRQEIQRWWTDAHIFSGQEDYVRQLQERDKRILNIIER